MNIFNVLTMIGGLCLFLFVFCFQAVKIAGEAAIPPAPLVLLHQPCVLQISQRPLDGAGRELQLTSNGLYPRPADTGGVGSVPQVDVDGFRPVAQFLLGIDKIKPTHVLPPIS